MERAGQWGRMWLRSPRKVRRILTATVLYLGVYLAGCGTTMVPVLVPVESVPGGMETPERMDGKSVLDYFGGRIAAEIRLPEAINRKLLCPFQYFGVTDTADLSNLKWRTGGYDKSELSNLYTISGMVAERRADLVVSSILKYVTDI